MNFFKRKFYKSYLSILDFFGASDEEITKIQYFLKNNTKPNLSSPKEFMEKILWLKLYYYTEAYGKFVDKFEVRNYVEEKIGKKYLNDLFGVYDSASEINFDNLPNQFAIKATHGSGYNIIVKNKSELNINKIKKKLTKFLSEKYYNKFRESIYKNVKPRLIIEKYISEADNESLIDYKFHCFNGQAKYVYVQKNKSKDITKCFYDSNWNKVLPEKFTPAFHNSDFKKPENFDEMIIIAEKLSQGFVFLRVDLYSIGNKIIFGELTFFSNGGLIRSSVERFNKEFGDLIKLPV